MKMNMKMNGIHFHLAPVEGLFFKPKYRANILCICFNFIAVLFLFLSSPWDQSTVFSIVSFDSNWSRSPKIRHSFALVCRCGLADIRTFIYSPAEFCFNGNAAQKVGWPSHDIGASYYTLLPFMTFICSLVSISFYCSLSALLSCF